jgi:hypothetical protein
MAKVEMLPKSTQCLHFVATTLSIFVSKRFNPLSSVLLITPMDFLSLPMKSHALTLIPAPLLRT